MLEYGKGRLIGKNPQCSIVCNKFVKLCKRYINIGNHLVGIISDFEVEVMDFLNFTLIPSLAVALDNSDTKLIITSK